MLQTPQNQPEDRAFIKGAGVCLVTPDLRILLLYQNQSQKWGIPKGHSEPGETPQQTWTRELYEETGIIIDSSFKEIGGPTKCYRYMVKFYLVDSMIIPNIRDHQEIGGYGWIPINEIQDVTINGATRSALDYLVKYIFKR